MVLAVNGAEAVHRTSHDVQHPAQGFGTHRHRDGAAGVLGRHAADQTISDVHGDGAHHVVPQMLGYFHHQVILDVVDGGVADKKCIADLRQ